MKKEQVEINSKIRKNVKLTVIYDGNLFSGWQKVYNAKADKPSIQLLLEEKVSDVYKQEISMIGSGRTDTGVHALGQVVNFYLNTMDCIEQIQQKMNAVLPEGISIIKVEFVPLEFHSRFDAKKKTYLYRFDVRERASVFTRNYTYPVGQKLNIEEMRKAANHLVGTHDFKAFSTDRKDGKSTIRTIYEITIHETYGKKDNTLSILYEYSNEVWIEITGSGFLYHMVRIMSGTLLEVGLGRRSVENIKEVLCDRKREKAGITISSQGLFLKEVFY